MKHVPNERTGEKKKRTTTKRMEARNLPDIEFKPAVIRILKELRKRIEELTENFIQRNSKHFLKRI